MYKLSSSVWLLFIYYLIPSQHHPSPPLSNIIIIIYKYYIHTGIFLLYPILQQLKAGMRYVEFDVPNYKMGWSETKKKRSKRMETYSKKKSCRKILYLNMRNEFYKFLYYLCWKANITINLYVMTKDEVNHGVHSDVYRKFVGKYENIWCQIFIKHFPSFPACSIFQII